MIKTFTHNELVQYVYNELQDEVKAQLETALLFDHQLAEECAELLVTKMELDQLSPRPGQNCISNILKYSQNLSLQS